MSKKKLLSLLLSLSMMLSLTLPVSALPDASAPTDGNPVAAYPNISGKLVILHTNDTHGADLAVPGNVIGTAGVSQLKKDFEAAGAEVLLFSAGDVIMGKPLVNESKGDTAIAFMNAAGYDAMTVGNHEMDYGYDNLKKLVSNAKFPVLSASVLNGSTGKSVFEANKIFTTKSGLKVGVFGMSTPETMTKADASKMQGLTFPQGEEMYETARAQVDELKKAGAEFIVCIGHLGIDEESINNRSVDLVNNVEGIDLFVDGHSHTEMRDGAPVKAGSYPTYENKSKTLIVSTGTALANVGVVVYDKTERTLNSSLISAKECAKVDESVNKLIVAENDKVTAKYSTVFAKTEVDLNGSRSGGTETSTKGIEVTFPAGVGNRVSETNLGNFATDAILWQAKKVLGEDKVDAALTNGGSIRKTISKGDISMLDMLDVFPFGNTVSTITVTGAELLEAIEAATAAFPAVSGAFPQISGIDLAVFTANAYVNGDKYPNSTEYAPKYPGERVAIITVGGKEFDVNATYTIATNDFTASGGDTYGAFKRVSTIKDIGVSLENALINYTTEVLKGVISEATYGSTQNRITIVAKDVPPSQWYAPATLVSMKAGYMLGTSKGFEPTKKLTVAQVCQILYNMAGKPEVKSPVFTDVEGQWYADAVNWAGEDDLLKGSVFGEDVQINRAETAELIASFLSSLESELAFTSTIDKSTDNISKAPDFAQIPAESVEAMAICYNAGLIVGSSTGNVNPDGVLSRAEMAQIINNLLSYIYEHAPGMAA